MMSRYRRLSQRLCKRYRGMKVRLKDIVSARRMRSLAKPRRATKRGEPNRKTGASSFATVALFVGVNASKLM
jgi:hypothetical protein